MPNQKEKGGQGDYEQSRRYPTEDKIKGNKHTEETEVGNGSTRGSVQTDQEISQ